MQQDVQTSAATFSIAETDGACAWSEEDIAECYGIVDISIAPVSGLVTTGVGYPGTDTFTDTTRDFINDGVKRGDVIENMNDETTLITRTAGAASSGATLSDIGANFTGYDPAGAYELLVLNNTTGVQGTVIEIIDNDTLVAEDYPGGSAISFVNGDNYSLMEGDYMVVTTVVSSDTITVALFRPSTVAGPDLDAGEYYRIKTASKVLSGNADNNDVTPPIVINDATADFITEGVEVGDIVENVTTGEFGVIDGVIATAIRTPNFYGVANTITAGDSYTIYHGHVSRREYQFRTGFRGTNNAVYTDIDGVRKRDLCIGYDATCASPMGMNPPAVSNKWDSFVPTVEIIDYGKDGDEVSTTTATIPSTGNPKGRIRISSIDYNLHSLALDANSDGDYDDANDIKPDIPEWFVRNKWYQYVYVAYSNGEIPGATPICTAGVDCLELTVNTSIRNNIRALVMITGEEVLAQDWSNGQLSDYFDLAENRDADRDFTRLAESANFNDKIRIAVSCPAPNANNLCWAN